MNLSGMWRYLWISGRSGRLEWWTIEILVVLGLWCDGRIYMAVKAAGIEMQGMPNAIRYANSLLLLWIGFASIVRRLHDRNKSGWWSPLYLVPFIGYAWYFIECGFLGPRNDNNAYTPQSISTVMRERPPSKSVAVATLGVAALIIMLGFISTVTRVTPVGINSDAGSFKNVTKALEQLRRDCATGKADPAHCE